MSDIDVRAINLNLLPALEALLVAGSVSGAARRMHVTQSAMSHSLARLREVFGDPLFVPAGRRLVATPRAREIAARLPRALDGLADAVRGAVAFDPRASTRTFRIATVDYFEMTALPATLAYLGAHAPGVALEVERISSSSFAELARGGIDLVLGSDMASVPAGVEKQLLFDEPYAVIVRPEHPRVGRRMTLARYVELDHLLVSLQGLRQGVVDRALAARGLSRRVALRVPSFLTAPLVVQRSDVVCTVPSTIAAWARDLLGLRTLRPPLEVPPAPAAAYWSTSHDHDPSARWFRRLFLDGDAVSPSMRSLIRRHGSSARR